MTNWPWSWALLAALAVVLCAASALAQSTGSSKQGKTQKKHGQVVVTKVENGGALPDEKVQSAIESNLKTLLKCYERELKSQPLLGGTIDFRVLFNGKGKAVAATVEGTSMGDEKVARCAGRHAMDIRLKMPPKAGHTTVRFQLRFMVKGADLGECERLIRCCGSPEVTGAGHFDAACQMVDQVRGLPDGAEACRSMLKAFQSYFGTISGSTIPPACQ